MSHVQLSNHHRRLLPHRHHRYQHHQADERGSVPVAEGDDLVDQSARESSFVQEQSLQPDPGVDAALQPAPKPPMGSRTGSDSEEGRFEPMAASAASRQPEISSSQPTFPPQIPTPARSQSATETNPGPGPYQQSFNPYNVQGSPLMQQAQAPPQFVPVLQNQMPVATTYSQPVVYAYANVQNPPSTTPYFTPQNAPMPLFQQYAPPPPFPSPSIASQPAVYQPPGSLQPVDSRFMPTSRRTVNSKPPMESVQQRPQAPDAPPLPVPASFVPAPRMFQFATSPSSVANSSRTSLPVNAAAPLQPQTQPQPQPQIVYLVPSQQPIPQTQLPVSPAQPVQPTPSQPLSNVTGPKQLRPPSTSSSVDLPVTNFLDSDDRSKPASVPFPEQGLSRRFSAQTTSAPTSSDSEPFMTPQSSDNDQDVSIESNTDLRSSDLPPFVNRQRSSQNASAKPEGSRPTSGTRRDHYHHRHHHHHPHRSPVAEEGDAGIESSEFGLSPDLGANNNIAADATTTPGYRDASDVGAASDSDTPTPSYPPVRKRRQGFRSKPSRQRTDSVASGYDGGESEADDGALTSHELVDAQPAGTPTVDGSWTDAASDSSGSKEPLDKRRASQPDSALPESAQSTRRRKYRHQIGAYIADPIARPTDSAPQDVNSVSSFDDEQQTARDGAPVDTQDRKPNLRSGAGADSMDDEARGDVTSFSDSSYPKRAPQSQSTFQEPDTRDLTDSSMEGISREPSFRDHASRYNTNDDSASDSDQQFDQQPRRDQKGEPESRPLDDESGDDSFRRAPRGLNRDSSADNSGSDMSNSDPDLDQNSGRAMSEDEFYHSEAYNGDPDNDRGEAVERESARENSFESRAANPGLDDGDKGGFGGNLSDDDMDGPDKRVPVGSEGDEGAAQSMDVSDKRSSTKDGDSAAGLQGSANLSDVDSGDEPLASASTGQPTNDDEFDQRNPTSKAGGTHIDDANLSDLDQGDTKTNAVAAAKPGDDDFGSQHSIGKPGAGESDGANLSDAEMTNSKPGQANLGGDGFSGADVDPKDDAFGTPASQIGADNGLDDGINDNSSRNAGGDSFDNAVPGRGNRDEPFGDGGLDNDQSRRQSNQSYDDGDNFGGGGLGNDQGSRQDQSYDDGFGGGGGGGLRGSTGYNDDYDSGSSGGGGWGGGGGGGAQNDYDRDDGYGGGNGGSFGGQRNSSYDDYGDRDNSGYNGGLGGGAGFDDGIGGRGDSRGREYDFDRDRDDLDRMQDGSQRNLDPRDDRLDREDRDFDDIDRGRSRRTGEEEDEEREAEAISEYHRALSHAHHSPSYRNAERALEMLRSVREIQATMRPQGRKRRPRVPLPTAHELHLKAHRYLELLTVEEAEQALEHAKQELRWAEQHLDTLGRHASDEERDEAEENVVQAKEKVFRAEEALERAKQHARDSKNQDRLPRETEYHAEASHQQKPEVALEHKALVRKVAKAREHLRNAQASNDPRKIREAQAKLESLERQKDEAYERLQDEHEGTRHHQAASHREAKSNLKELQEKDTSGMTPEELKRHHEDLHEAHRGVVESRREKMERAREEYATAHDAALASPNDQKLRRKADEAKARWQRKTAQWRDSQSEKQSHRAEAFRQEAEDGLQKLKERDIAGMTRSEHEEHQDDLRRAQERLVRAHKDQLEHASAKVEEARKALEANPRDDQARKRLADAEAAFEHHRKQHAEAHNELKAHHDGHLRQLRAADTSGMSKDQKRRHFENLLDAHENVLRGHQETLEQSEQELKRAKEHAERNPNDRAARGLLANAQQRHTLAQQAVAKAEHRKTKDELHSLRGEDTSRMSAEQEHAHRVQLLDAHARQVSAREHRLQKAHQEVEEAEKALHDSPYDEHARQRLQEAEERLKRKQRKLLQAKHEQAAELEHAKLRAFEREHGLHDEESVSLSDGERAENTSRRGHYGHFHPASHEHNAQFHQGENGGSHSTVHNYHVPSPPPYVAELPVREVPENAKRELAAETKPTGLQEREQKLRDSSAVHERHELETSGELERARQRHREHGTEETKAHLNNAQSRHDLARLEHSKKNVEAKRGAEIAASQRMHEAEKRFGASSREHLEAQAAHDKARQEHKTARHQHRGFENAVHRSHARLIDDAEQQLQLHRERHRHHLERAEHDPEHAERAKEEAEAIAKLEKDVRKRRDKQQGLVNEHHSTRHDTLQTQLQQHKTRLQEAREAHDAAQSHYREKQSPSSAQAAQHASGHVKLVESEYRGAELKIKHAEHKHNFDVARKIHHEKQTRLSRARRHLAGFNHDDVEARQRAEAEVTQAKKEEQQAKRDVQQHGSALYNSHGHLNEHEAAQLDMHRDMHKRYQERNHEQSSEDSEDAKQAAYHADAIRRLETKRHRRDQKRQLLINLDRHESDIRHHARSKRLEGEVAQTRTRLNQADRQHQAATDKHRNDDSDETRVAVENAEGKLHRAQTAHHDAMMKHEHHQYKHGLHESRQRLEAKSVELNEAQERRERAKTKFGEGSPEHLEATRAFRTAKDEHHAAHEDHRGHGSAVLNSYERLDRHHQSKLDRGQLSQDEAAQIQKKAARHREKQAQLRKQLEEMETTHVRRHGRNTRSGRGVAAILTPQEVPRQEPVSVYRVEVPQYQPQGQVHYEHDKGNKRPVDEGSSLSDNETAHEKPHSKNHVMREFEPKPSKPKKSREEKQAQLEAEHQEHQSAAEKADEAYKHASEAHRHLKSKETKAMLKHAEDERNRARWHLKTTVLKQKHRKHKQEHHKSREHLDNRVKELTAAREHLLQVEDKFGRDSNEYKQAFAAVQTAEELHGHAKARHDKAGHTLYESHQKRTQHDEVGKQHHSKRHRFHLTAQTHHNGAGDANEHVQHVQHHEREIANLGRRVDDRKIKMDRLHHQHVAHIDRHGGHDKHGRLTKEQKKEKRQKAKANKASRKAAESASGNGHKHQQKKRDLHEPVTRRQKEIDDERVARRERRKAEKKAKEEQASERRKKKEAHAHKTREEKEREKHEYEERRKERKSRKAEARQKRREAEEKDAALKAKRRREHDEREAEAKRKKAEKRAAKERKKAEKRQRELQKLSRKRRAKRRMLTIPYDDDNGLENIKRTQRFYEKQLERLKTEKMRLAVIPHKTAEEEAELKRVQKRIDAAEEHIEEAEEAIREGITMAVFKDTVTRGIKTYKTLSLHTTLESAHPQIQDDSLGQSRHFDRRHLSMIVTFPVPEFLQTTQFHRSVMTQTCCTYLHRSTDHEVSQALAVSGLPKCIVVQEMLMRTVTLTGSTFSVPVIGNRHEPTHDRDPLPTIDNVRPRPGGRSWHHDARVAADDFKKIFRR
ncbi:hypothetical protein OIV83_005334 [Microbotryomycetes sp. JL201]|nr:hypothetical protein OIV83_005334 [Microbotryomycetes sp. JL201]